jgi:hypothetical protein
VKEHNEAARIVVALVNHVRNQPAASGVDDHRGLAVRRGMRQYKSDNTEHNAKRGAQPLSPLHRGTRCAAGCGTRA